MNRKPGSDLLGMLPLLRPQGVPPSYSLRWAKQSHSQVETEPAAWCTLRRL